MVFRRALVIDISHELWYNSAMGKQISNSISSSNTSPSVVAPAVVSAATSTEALVVHESVEPLSSDAPVVQRRVQATHDDLALTGLQDGFEEYTEADEAQRMALVKSLDEHGKKTNVLSVDDADRARLVELTRRRYMSMESARQAMSRLFTTLNENFPDSDEVESLKDLARHAVGLYLNTDQYHSAPHPLGMATEALSLAKIAGHTDPMFLKALLYIGLYHDAGNGRTPVAPVDEKADEVQSFQIFLNDVLSPDKLKALQNIRSETVTIGGQAYAMINVVAAGIAATVFRDRFVAADDIAFDSGYANIILEKLHGKPIGEIPEESLKEFKTLMESNIAWLARSADIAGSTSRVNVLQANLTNHYEDLGRGIGVNDGPVGYHWGFVAFLRGVFHKGKDSEAVQQAKSGSPFYVPDGNKEAVVAYGRQRLAEEQERFDQLMLSHKPIMVAIYTLIAENFERKDNVLAWPLSRIRESLTAIAAAPEGLRGAVEAVQKKGFMTKEVVEGLNLDVSASTYPLLFDEHYADKTIAELSPDDVNRIFAPER